MFMFEKCYFLLFVVLITARNKIETKKNHSDLEKNYHHWVIQFSVKQRNSSNTMTIGKIIVLILRPRHVVATLYVLHLCRVWSFYGRRRHYYSVLLPVNKKRFVSLKIEFLSIFCFAPQKTARRVKNSSSRDSYTAVVSLKSHSFMSP